MNDETPRPGPWSTRNMLTVGILLAIAFLAGFVWQWFAADDARDRLDEVRLELTFEKLENHLAAAVIQVENDSYEGARELMSRFFTGLQANVGNAPEGARQELESLLDRRDAVITALSREDPGSDHLLTRMYTRFQVAMGGPEVGIPIPAPGALDSVPAREGEGAAGARDTSGGTGG